MRGFFTGVLITVLCLIVLKMILASQKDSPMPNKNEVTAVQQKDYQSQLGAINRNSTKDDLRREGISRESTP